MTRTIRERPKSIRRAPVQKSNRQKRLCSSVLYSMLHVLRNYFEHVEIYYGFQADHQTLPSRP